MRKRTVAALVRAGVVSSVLVSFLPVRAAASDHVVTIEQARAVRTVWTGDFGVPRPDGLAYVPAVGADGTGELIVPRVRGGVTSALRLGFDEDAHGFFRLPDLSNPSTLSFDAARARLSAVDGDAVISVPASELQRHTPRVTHADVSSLGLRAPQAASFDPVSGTWFVLDASAQAVVEVPRPRAPQASARISLAGLGAARFAGLAFNPADRRLYVATADQRMLYALDPSTGAVERSYTLASLNLRNPKAIVFAPSSDNTDDPATLNLFIADAGGSGSLGGVTEATLAPAATLAAATVTATLVQTIDTSKFSPASPDPSGVVYIPARGQLEIADSEVDETTGAGYHGVNLWQVTRTGTVTDTGTTEPYSYEPTGLGYDSGKNILFISDDDARRVWVVKPGGDGRFGTSDDVVTSINAGAYGSTDTEDPEFLGGHLFFLDGVGTEVYDINPVDGVFGDGDDVMTHFDVGKFGPTDWEGLGSDPASGNLLVGARTDRRIYEVTTSGSLVRIIDTSGISAMRYISGLGMAPASDNSGALHYWIVDRGVDNDSVPSENDGKLFEVAAQSSSTNNPPVVTNPGSISSAVGDSVSYQISASDPDGDQLTSYGASGLPTGLSVNTSNGLISGTTTTAGTYNVTISATDSRGATGTASFTWTVSGTASVLTFGPAADTYVRSDRPNQNLGSKPTFLVDASPIKHGLLKFSVSGIGSRTITSVKLRLYCVNASPVGGTLYPVADNSWLEQTVTYNTEPAAGTTSIGALGSVASNTWYQVDLTSYVRGDGTYSIRIASSSSNAATYVTKEGTAGFAPSLVVTLGS